MTGVRRALFSDNQEPILGRLLVPEQGERWFRFCWGHNSPSKDRSAGPCCCLMSTLLSVH